MEFVDFFVRNFLVFILAIEIILLPFEIRFLLKKSTRDSYKQGEMMGCMELAILFNILLTLVLAIVVVITQRMMF